MNHSYECDWWREELETQRKTTPCRWITHMSVTGEKRNWKLKGKRHRADESLIWVWLVKRGTGNSKENNTVQMNHSYECDWWKEELETQRKTTPCRWITHMSVTGEERNWKLKGKQHRADESLIWVWLVKRGTGNSKENNTVQMNHSYECDWWREELETQRKTTPCRWITHPGSSVTWKPRGTRRIMAENRPSFTLLLSIVVADYQVCGFSRTRVKNDFTSNSTFGGPSTVTCHNKDDNRPTVVVLPEYLLESLDMLDGMKRHDTRVQKTAHVRHGSSIHLHHTRTASINTRHHFNNTNTQ